MVEQSRFTISRAENVRSIYETHFIASELTTPQFLHSWYKGLRSGGLYWYADRRPKSDPLMSVKLDYTTDPKSGADVTVRVASLPAEYWQRVVPVSMGIQHCSIPPLHGAIALDVTDETLAESEEVKGLFSAMGIPYLLTGKEKYHLAAKITEPTELPASLLEVVQKGCQDDILKALDLSPKHRALAYLDENVAKLVNAAVFALVRNHRIFPRPDTGVQTVYHKKLQEMGLGPYGFDVYDEYANGTSVKQGLVKVLTGSKRTKLTKQDFYRMLIEYFEAEGGAAFAATVPPLKADVKLDSQVFRFYTDTVMSYVDFQQRVAGLLPVLHMPMISDSAQHIFEVSDDIDNALLTTQSGMTMGLFMSRSSGFCPEHDVH